MARSSLSMRDNEDSEIISEGNSPKKLKSIKMKNEESKDFSILSNSLLKQGAFRLR